MRPLACSGWIAWLLVPISACATPQPPGGWAAVDVVIANVSLVTMREGLVLADHAVAITEGRVAWIGVASDVPENLAATIVDGERRYLIPGLIDMHVHTSERDLPLFIAAGVTTVLFKHGAPEHLEWRSLAEQGEIVSPRIRSTGPMIAGREIHWPHAVAESPAEASRLVREQAGAGYDFIKVYDFLSPTAYDSLASAARALDIPFLGHIPQGVSLERALSAGQLCFDHAEQLIYAFVGRERSMAVTSDEVDSITTAFSGHRGCLTSTLFGMKAIMLRGTPWFDSLYSRPVMEFVDADVAARWAPFHGATPSPEALARRTHFYDAQRELTKRLAEQGVMLVAGTDTPNLLLVPGYALHDELELLVDDVGLPPFEALRATTIQAAKLLGMAGELGEIAPGARADLVLLDGNPLDDIEAVRRTRGVMVRGRWYDRGELEQILDALREPRTP